MDLVIGTRVDPGAIEQLISEVTALPLTDATLYVGYPILSTADDSISIDAILTCIEHGVVVFDLRPLPESTARPSVIDWELIEARQNEIAIALTSKLIKHKELTQRRQLAVPIHIVTYVSTRPHEADSHPDILVAVHGDLATMLDELGGIGQELSIPLNAAVQQVATIKPRKKRLNVTSENSRGGILKIIEREIANLDSWQKRAAIECPDGPQRIRGLAGSGKTVVLALKAAYLHAQHPEWRIAVTFQTRSLYGQLRDLIRRFTFEHIQDEPNWERLQVMHAWGGASDPGVYSSIAKANSCSVKDFSYGKRKYLAAGAFEGVCKELLHDLSEKGCQSVFDAILIDEAQDFGPNFFRAIYSATNAPKRIIWAYDELQSLKETGLASPTKLFGKDANGQPLVTLTNRENEPQEDVILPVCYRNTPWALSMAHALGFGVYRKDGLIQMFDVPQMWDDVGYEVVAGRLEPKESVTLERRSTATPSFFSRLLDHEDAVQAHTFSDDIAQALWVADEIYKNVTDEELEPSDIVVIFADPVKVASDAGPLVAELRKRNINCHIAGVTRSVDEFVVNDSVAISGIYRAKGNEAPIIYILGAQYCYGGWGSMIRRRNILFTAITRSRAWVRLCGVGEDMNRLVDEWNRVRDNGYKLVFQVPTEEELKQLRQIHRDRTDSQIQKIDSSRKSLEEIVALLETEELTIDDIPANVRRKLKKLLGE